MGGRDQNRRREPLVEHDGLVIHFDDARGEKPGEARFRRLADLIGEPLVSDIDLLLDPELRGGIDECLGVNDIAAGALRIACVDLTRIGRRFGHRQPHIVAGSTLRHDDRGGKRAVGGQIEGRSVGEHARRPSQAELVLLSKVAIELDLRKPPRIGRCLADPAFDEMFEIAVVLLQMVRSKKQALGPDDLAIP